MLRFLAAAATCLSLSAAAAAQDMPGLATLSPPDLAQPPAAEPGAAPHNPEIRPGTLTLRGTGPVAGQSVAELRTPTGTPRPWCAQERRVGTGAGFCLIN
jgi:hypothetical protein